MTWPYRNLVFEGGGAKGVAYLGALEVLDGEGILDGITRVGGASAGAIQASLLALGLDAAEVDAELAATPLTAFQDDSPGWLLDVVRLVRQHGWHKGRALEAWVEGHCRERLGEAKATFQDLATAAATGPQRELHLVASDITTGYSRVFSPLHTPQVPLAEAVRMSMAFPFFFAAKRRYGHVYVDGGLLNNYPVKLFDREVFLDPLDEDQAGEAGHEPGYYRSLDPAPDGGPGLGAYVFNRQTLGFRLDPKQEIAAYRTGEVEVEPVTGLADFTRRVVKAVMSLQDRRHLHSDDWRRTVYIDTKGVGTLDFEKAAADPGKLVTSGREGTEAYLQWVGKVGWENVWDAER